MRINDDGSITVDHVGISGKVPFAGEADILAMVRLMPGVTSTSDYSSGMSVDGADFSHTMYSIDGAPVFFPYHFGGIFSTFNVRHFSRTVVDRNQSAGRIGGSVDLTDTPGRFRRLAGAVSLGVISSGASVTVPLGRRGGLIVSGRVSYLNLLYSSLLKSRDNDIRYNFSDWNIAGSYALTDRDNISLQLFGNDDRLVCADGNYLLDCDMEWGNRLASLCWTHSADDIDWKQSLFVSRFGNTLSVGLPGFSIGMPSDVMLYGSSGEATLRHGSAAWHLGYGLDYVNVDPQAIGHTDFSSGYRLRQFRRHCGNVSLSAGVSVPVNRGFEIEAGADGSLFASSRHDRYVSVDPRLRLGYTDRTSRISVIIRRSHQYFHQIGFSDIGMSTDFWIGSTDGLRPQSAWTLSADCMRYITVGGEQFKLAAHAFARKLSDAHEYGGDILSVIDADYDVYASVLTGKGYAVGASVTASKDMGRFSGWVSCSYVSSRLKYDEYPGGYLPSVNDAGLSVSCFGNVSLGRHWSVSCTWNYASGRRTTPVEAIYMIAENVVIRHGERNSARFPAYHRLDCMASYRFNTAGRMALAHQLSLSLINAYGRRNVEMQNYRFDIRTGRYSVKRTSSLYRFLPSVSYAVEF